jgi:hypothetical protein
MNQGICAPIGLDAFERGGSSPPFASGPLASRAVFLSALAGAAAFALAAGVGALMFHPPSFGALKATKKPQAIAAPTFGSLADASALKVASFLPRASHGVFFEPDYAYDLKPATAAHGFADRSALEPLAPPVAAAAPEPAAVPPAQKAFVATLDDLAPLPPSRPAEFVLPLKPPALPATLAPVQQHLAPQSRKPAVAAAPADNRSFFEKLFGVADAAKPAPKPGLAYASAETSVPSVARAEASGPSSGPSARYDKFTAVYDLTAHVVYLPDGTRLEAHSGYGDRLDDPNHVSERDRGATPPHVYALEPREQLFHGVQALRLTPVSGGGGDLFGRAGLLAHSYMLGPNGDSNGCVSFKDYEAFLRAYQNGQVKRLAVVARLN